MKTNENNNNIIDKGGKTPLHYAAENNSKKIGEVLISKGADINAKEDIIYLNILMLFLINGIYNKWRKLNKKNDTPLHEATENNSKEMLELLISKGADINAKTYDNKNLFEDPGGKTPLHYAAENNSKEIGELLISKGADINAKAIIYLNIEILFLIKII